MIKETVISNGWLEEEMFANIIAVSESTPEPIMVNTATYIAMCRAVYVTCNINLLMYSPKKCKVKKKKPQEKRTCGKNTKHNKLKKVTSCSKIQANSHHDSNLMEHSE